MVMMVMMVMVKIIMIYFLFIGEEVRFKLDAMIMRIIMIAYKATHGKVQEMQSVWFERNNKFTFLKVSFLATSSSRNEAHFAAGEAPEEAADESEE